MANEDLADPTDDEAIILTDSGVPFGRPIMFGDIFRNVACSRGGVVEDFVMVMSHPCSMRRGVVLKERILTALVAPFDQKLSGEKWRAGFFDLFPVATLPRPGARAVQLVELHSAQSSDLKLDDRIAALSDYGVAVLLQRWIYQLSRNRVPLEDLHDLVSPVMGLFAVEGVEVGVSLIG